MNKYLINKPMMLEEIDLYHVNDPIYRYSNFDYCGEIPNWCVYLHINKQNNKMYAGITSNIIERWGRNGERYIDCNKFYNAIKKYTWNGFQHIVLMNGLTKTMAGEIEKYLIKKFDLRNSKYGYNIKEGGFLNSKKAYTNNDRKVPIHQYDLNGIYIQSFDSCVDAIKTVTDKPGSISCCLSNKNHFGYGFLWSKELVDQMPPYMPVHPNYKNEDYKPTRYSEDTILQISKDNRIINKYKNIYAISDDIDVRYFINCCLSGKKEDHIYKGTFWFYESDYKKEIIDNITENKKIIHNRTPILIYNLDGEFLGKFESVKEAARFIGVKNISSISSCCNHLTKIVNGCYQCIYEGDEIPKKYSVPSARDKLHSKPVAKIDMNSNCVINIYNSLRSASKSLDESRDFSKRIKYTAEGYRESAYGYIWRYVDENNNIIEPSEINKGGEQYDTRKISN